MRATGERSCTARSMQKALRGSHQGHMAAAEAQGRNEAGLGEPLRVQGFPHLRLYGCGLRDRFVDVESSRN